MTLYTRYAMSTADRETNSHTQFDDANLPQRQLNYRWECEGDETQLLSCPLQNSTSSCNVEKLGGVYCFGENIHHLPNTVVIIILLLRKKP